MNNIEEIVYEIPAFESFSFSEPLEFFDMKKIVQSPTFRTECRELKLDTPIRYSYRGRTGYLRVQKFLLTCLPTERILITVGDERSYIVHPDYEQTAVEVEKEILKEQNRKLKVGSESVLVSEFQTELNQEEFFVW